MISIMQGEKERARQICMKLITCKLTMEVWGNEMVAAVLN
jgi:hypothetical protein